MGVVYLFLQATLWKVISNDYFIIVISYLIVVAWGTYWNRNIMDSIGDYFFPFAAIVLYKRFKHKNNIRQ